MASQVESLYRSGAGPSKAGADWRQRFPSCGRRFCVRGDVRQALRLSRKIVVGERTIVTPAARDLADAHRVFINAAWKP
jgi:hypothetical protein